MRPKGRYQGLTLNLYLRLTL